jgi:hypothetical protein
VAWSRFVAGVGKYCAAKEKQNKRLGSIVQRKMIRQKQNKRNVTNPFCFFSPVFNQEK